MPLFLRLEEDSECPKHVFFHSHKVSLQAPPLLLSLGFAEISTGYMPVTTLSASYFVG